MVDAMKQRHEGDHREPEREWRPPSLEPNRSHWRRNEDDGEAKEQKCTLLLSVHLGVPDRLQTFPDFVEDDWIVDRRRHLPRTAIRDLLHGPTKDLTGAGLW